MAKEKLYALRLTERELWFLSEGFTASFTAPEERNDHEVKVSEKIDELQQKARGQRALAKLPRAK